MVYAMQNYPLANITNFGLFTMQICDAFDRFSLNRGRAAGAAGYVTQVEEIVMTAIRQFLRDEAGATAIEYGLIAALVSVAGIGALTALGGSLSGIFSFVSSTLSGAVTS